MHISRPLPLLFPSLSHLLLAIAPLLVCPCFVRHVPCSRIAYTLHKALSALKFEFKSKRIIRTASSEVSAILTMGTWSLVVHGGAGVISKDMPLERRQLYYEGLGDALKVGEGVLASGGSSLDAVEQTVRFLEDCPLFNAGRGAVLTAAGTYELEACIMEGHTLRTGACSGLRTVRNPIRLARQVMEKGGHNLLAFGGAEAFADEASGCRVLNTRHPWARQLRRADRPSSGTGGGGAGGPLVLLRPGPLRPVAGAGLDPLGPHPHQATARRW